MVFFNLDVSWFKATVLGRTVTFKINKFLLFLNLFNIIAVLSVDPLSSAK